MTRKEDRTKETAAHSPLQIYAFVIAQKNDLVPPYYRAQMINEFLLTASEVTGSKFELRAAQGLEPLEMPDAPNADLIIVNVMGMDKSAKATFKPLERYLEKHPKTKYGVFAIEEYVRQVRKAGLKNVIAHSSEKEQKIAFVGPLLVAAQMSKVSNL